jgi:hypothetical protein
MLKGVSNANTVHYIHFSYKAQRFYDGISTLSIHTFMREIWYFKFLDKQDP